MDLNPIHQICCKKKKRENFVRHWHRQILHVEDTRIINNKSKNRQDYVQQRNFCTAEEALNKMKRQPAEWEKIFADQANDRGFITRICK